MSGIKGRLYFRKLEVVDDNNEVIYKASEVPINAGLSRLFQIIEYKDGRKTLRNILVKFSDYMDKDFKTIFKKEDKNVK